ncbi:YczE/YyaS/YitT family protein [Tepidibacillus sp. LV47]|uniref:YczE/YyaS/YitT family protein n=1 Tax=Tepidibacillus sp. LV47 TaxID=3398228 RepID=UPI003AB10006
MKKEEIFYRIVFFFIGLIVMSLGIALTIEANLGVSAWDVLHIGLYKTFGLTIGTWSQIAGLIIVLFTYLLDKKVVFIGTLLNMIFVGWFIDLFLFILPTMHKGQWFYQSLFFILGMIIMAIGTGMYITSNLGAGPRDGLMLVLSNRLNWSIRKVKTWMELIVLVIGFFLGGPVFIGTLILSVFIGPLMQFFITFWGVRFENILRLHLSKEKEKWV